tara:strand:- start:1343 stop:2026 length:684 start_codon:yes stop_codon:yes gene_type:complete
MSLKNKDRTSKGYIVDELHRWNILLDTREIYIHGAVDNLEDDPGVDWKMSNNFIKNLHLLERMDSSKPIVIHMHSIGGEWCEGMMMYDAIKNCTSPTVAITHGIAASMGSAVPLAASLVVSMPSCWWMIHDGYTDISEQTYKQSLSWAEWEKETRKQMIEIYLESCKTCKFFKGKTNQQIKNFIIKNLDKKEDWWLNSKQAQEYGFVDGIYGAKGFASIEEIVEHVC